MLRTRIITALTAFPVVAIAIYLGGYWFFVGCLALALIGGWEFSRMMGAGGYRTTRAIVLGLIAALLFDAFYSSLRLLDVIISIALLASLVRQLLTSRSTAPTVDWALTLAGGLYIGWGMGRLVALRELADGLAWVWLALFANWSADTFAYFVGRTLGRHRLWPRLSPKKTWEGLGGGIFGGLFGAALVTLFAPSLSFSTTLIIGAIVPIAGLFGDLSISMMKRHVGVKDSSNWFPGHGGFLDRMDSVLFVSILVYYYAVWIG